MPAELPCAFDGHAHRADICQGVAVVFFRTAKGTIWPLCRACSNRHREVCFKMARDGVIPETDYTEARFDLDLDDSETLAAFKAQGPERIAQILGKVDAKYDELVNRFLDERVPS